MLKFEDLPEVLTADHIAEYLQISKNFAYELMKKPVENGGIKSKKVSRLVRCYKDDFEEYLGRSKLA